MKNMVKIVKFGIKIGRIFSAKYSKYEPAKRILYEIKLYLYRQFLDLKRIITYISEVFTSIPIEMKIVMLTSTFFLFIFTAAFKKIYFKRYCPTVELRNSTIIAKRH